MKLKLNGKIYLGYPSFVLENKPLYDIYSNANNFWMGGNTSGCKEGLFIGKATCVEIIL